MTSDTGRVVKRAGSGVAGYYVDENAALTEAQASWDQITLTAKKIAAWSGSPPPWRSRSL